jgi:2-dehydro-3-deoxyphosphogluconate aldolase/(4S)-4-hydroxy-2-oxoglutarate aldolase
MLTHPEPHPLVEEVRRLRLFAVIRTDSSESAEQAALACSRGGIRFIEVTLTTPNALEVVLRLARDPHLIVGLGSVMTHEDIEAGVAVGARFSVSPHFDEALVASAKSAGMMVAAGGFTATEAMTAHRAGADIIKIFPGSAVGPSYIKGLREPMPFLRLMPTGGVDEANLGDWLRAGAIGAGLGGSLLPKDALKNRDWGAIEKKARAVTTIVSTLFSGAGLTPRPE